MRAQELMTTDTRCCTPDSSLQEVAMLMADCDCGAIPVVDESKHLQGMVTDRDIACRAVSKGMDPSSTPVRQVMSTDVLSVSPDQDLDQIISLMEQAQVRRVPVTDGDGCCVGIIAQADIARRSHDELSGELVEQISQPNANPKGDAARAV